VPFASRTWLIFTLEIEEKMNCYCCSGKNFVDCCAPFIRGAAKPSTAEELMRSRYSAYAIVEVEYILRTTHPSTRRFHEPRAIEQWAKASKWQKLEIISTDKGASADKQGTVEFKAYYLDANERSQIHHEISNFRKALGKWFFVDGRVL
jgi:SEC-C motif domain protein